MELDLFRYLCFYHKTCITMNKGTHFIGQPMYGQLINLLDKSKILRFSRENGGERYVKHFDAWQHLVIMLYAQMRSSPRTSSSPRLPRTTASCSCATSTATHSLKSLKRTPF